MMITPEWLLEGLPPPPSLQNKILAFPKPSMEEITLKIKTADYEPHLPKNAMLYANKISIQHFKNEFKGMYLYLHNDGYIPAHIQPSIEQVFSTYTPCIEKSRNKSF